MKKILFCMAAAALSCGIMQAETIAVNSEVADTIKISAAGTYTLEGDGTRCTMPVIVEENLGEVTLILNNVNVQVTGAKDSGISALSVRKGTNATINFQGVDTLKSKADPGCGLEAIGNVTLNGEANAELHCLAQGWAAGIGVSPRPKGKELISGDITINSGIIEAKGSWESPGIGAGPGCKMPNVTINGGFVTAWGVSGAAGIGTGYSSWDKCFGEATIAINGGTIISRTGSKESALPIGVAKDENCTIHLVIAGGSLKAINSENKIYTAKPIPATNVKGDSVVLFQAQLENTTEATAITKGHIGSIVLGKDYLLKDVYTDAEGYVYFWLPKQEENVEVALNAGEDPGKPDQPDQPGDMTTILVNSTVSDTIRIAAAGNYLLQGDGTNCTMPVVVNADIADTVFVTAENANIVIEKNASAMCVGANSKVVLNVKGANSFKGNNGCGIEAAGDLIINGTVADTLDCKGAGRSAAIGTTKNSAAAGNITINGGVIYAQSGSESAAIGASNAGRLGNITINGGQVYATGGAYSSAIGASYCSTGDAVITIKGGVITAQAGYYNDNRSIGKSKTHRNSVSTVVLGGSVIAKGEKGEMNGVVVDATDGIESLMLFTYTLPEQPSTLVTEGHIGGVELGKDYGINGVYTDAEGKLYFYLPENAQKAEVVINGVKLQDGEMPDKPQPGETTTILVNSTVTGNILIKTAGDYLLQGDGTICTFPIIVATDLGDINITLDGVSVEVTGAKDAGVSAMLVGEGTNATIAFKGFNSLKSTADPGCGLEAKGNIILNGEDNAELHCTAKGWAAAIGSTPRPKSKVMASGDITINSGLIFAQAEWESAGIGASIDCDAHNITINGGRIEAKGGAQAAGIGTGYSQWGQSKGKGTLTINGGTIVAAAGSNESSWGADDAYAPLGVVKGDKASMDIVVTGGSVKACRSDMSAFPTPIAAKDAAGTDLALFKAQLQGATEPMIITEGHIGSIVLGTNYGIKDVYTDAEGYVYFYLPAQPADVEVVLNGKKPENPGQAIDEVLNNATAPVKVMYNGVLYIVRDGVMYTVTGAVVR